MNCCVMDIPKFSGLKTHIYHLTIFVGQNLRLGLSGFSASGSLSRLSLRCQLRLGSHVKACLGKDPLGYSLTVVGRMHASKPVGLRSSIPCWPWVGVRWFLVTWVSLTQQLPSSKLGESLQTRQKL